MLNAPLLSANQRFSDALEHAAALDSKILPKHLSTETSKSKRKAYIANAYGALENPLFDLKNISFLDLINAAKIGDITLFDKMLGSMNIRALIARDSNAVLNSSIVRGNFAIFTRLLEKEDDGTAKFPDIIKELKESGNETVRWMLNAQNAAFFEFLLKHFQSPTLTAIIGKQLKACDIECSYPIVRTILKKEKDEREAGELHDHIVEAGYILPPLSEISLGYFDKDFEKEKVAADNKEKAAIVNTFLRRFDTQCSPIKPPAPSRLEGFSLGGTTTGNASTLPYSRTLSFHPKPGSPTEVAPAQPTLSPTFRRLFQPD